MGGAMVPRWVGERPSCAVVIDTSSSITRHDLDLARSAGHFLGRVADVTYYGCSTFATNYGAQMPEELIGHGGTNMRAGIDTAIADGAKAVIVITDCETDWDPQHVGEPIMPVIVAANLAAEKVLSGQHAINNPGMPWAQIPPEWITVLPVVDR